MTEVIGDKPFAISEFSYGGYIARGILYQRFEQVVGMFLFAPVINSEASKRKMQPEPITLVANPDVMARIPEPMREIVAGACVIQTENIIQRIQDEIALAFTRSNFDFLGVLRQEENYRLSFAVDELPEPFTKPVVFLAGRQDSSVGFAGAMDILPVYPRASYVVLDRAGHNLHMEQPALVTEWLARICEVHEGEYVT